jgi:DNA-binding response OmpR family regulator
VQTVLVLEDDAAILGLIRLLVKQEGYKVLEATSAEQAFERFEENHAAVDLLIADLTLPTSSGIRVALELRALLPCLSIIITSGFPLVDWNEKDAAGLEELTSASVITLQKPFVATTLLNSVHKLIGLPFTAAPGLQVRAAS